MYTLNQLEIFVRVAETGSFNKAAEEVFLTPSAVMKHVNNLEKEIGAALFLRTYRGQSMTRAGEQLFKDAKKILELCEISVENVHAAAMLEKNVIRLGTAIMYPSDIFADIWQEVQKRDSTVSIEIVPFDSIPNSEGYIIPYPGTSIDVAVTTYDDLFLKARNLNAVEVVKVPLCVNLSVNHRLADKEKITLSDFEGETLIVTTDGRDSNCDKFKRSLINSGINVKIEEIGYYSIDLYNKCAASDEMLLGTGLHIKMHPLLKRIPIDMDIESSLGIIYSKEPTPAVIRFISLVKEVLQEGV